jgi:hypothetical protein
VSVAAAVASRLYLASSVVERRRFERALSDPAGAQRDVLMRIVLGNAYSAFGRRHGFLGVRSVEDYRARVDVHDYDQLEQDIVRTADGTRRLLTTDSVVCFELTGGSSGPNKLVPYTRSLLREFSRATVPWVHDLLRHRPALRNGCAYWAVTPPARRPSRVPSGIPIGMEHDSDYFPAFVRGLLDRVIGTPRALARAPDVDTWRYLTLRSLLAIPDLAFVSVWNPSFVTLLADALDEHWPRLIEDLASGHLSVPMPHPLRAEMERALPARPQLASRLRRRFGNRAPQDLGDLWTRLALISCWTDAHAARALPGLVRRFPRVEIQGKGLLATEGVVSIPLMEVGGCVAAVTSHFLEFIPERDPSRVLGVDELNVGESYEVLLTTSGGLYRYRLRDLVRVDGHYQRTPILSFQGRADLTSDLVGEKLTPMFAERVLQAAATETGVQVAFAMLAPVWDAPPHYDLLVECESTEAERFAGAVEAHLASSHHYALCRRLGQLDRVRAVVVEDGARAYERACVSRGQRLGSIKPAALDLAAGVR